MVGDINTIGIILLLVGVVGMLLWQKRLWDASDAARYYAKYPPTYMDIKIYCDELEDPELGALCDLETAVVESMGLDMGGGVYSFASYGMSQTQAEYLVKILQNYFWAIGVKARIEFWQHYDNDKGEEEQNAIAL